MSEWKEIKSAPKDGTKIDLWVVFLSGGYRWTDARWLESGAHSCSGPAGWCSSERYPLHAFTERPSATHWMPLPSPPEEHSNE